VKLTRPDELLYHIPMNQRWRDRLDSYRSPEECINPLRYDVAAIDEDTIAKTFVTHHHYSASYPAARFRFGLYRAGALVGVAVYSHPSQDKVLTNVFPGRATDSVELGRFVLLDSVEGNGETWFLARTFELLRRQELRGVVSFSDPLPRENRIEQRTVFAGHFGTIYQAHNAQYLGRGTKRTLHLLPNGTVFSARAQQKIRSGDRGWRYSAALLEAFGATSCPTTRRTAWLRHWLPRLTETVRHPGNFKYAWRLHRKVELRGTVHPYPKRGC
jgi:hypothetical protein